MDKDTSYEDYESWVYRVERNDWENREAFGITW